MQRFTWDMRYPGPWAPNAPNGGGGGPMVAPGKYTVRSPPAARPDARVRAEVDPRVTGRRRHAGDLDEQVAFQLKVRDAISDARSCSRASKRR